MGFVATTKLTSQKQKQERTMATKTHTSGCTLTTAKHEHVALNHNGSISLLPTGRHSSHHHPRRHCPPGCHMNPNHCPTCRRGLSVDLNIAIQRRHSREVKAAKCMPYQALTASGFRGRMSSAMKMLRAQHRQEV